MSSLTPRNPVTALSNRIEGARFVLNIYPDAHEGSGTFIPTRPYARGGGVKGYAKNPERSAHEAARRAKAKVRRYCASHRLNRLGTLTYEGAGCHDQLALRRDVAEFFRNLRDGLGGEAFPYVWVPEWHKTDHGLHVHFAVGKYINRSLIEEAWQRGFVHIKLLGDLPVGSGTLAEARLASGYLSKYVGKSFLDNNRLDGLHRYEVAQKFEPRFERIEGTSPFALFDLASDRFGSQPAGQWFSDEDPDWQGGIAFWAWWN